MHVLDRPRLICDFETFSEVDVTDVGSWAYAAHPSTEIMCLSHKRPGHPSELWIPGEVFPQYIIDHILAGHPIEAHQCQFERAIWTLILNPQFQVPVPLTWIDTMASCAYKSVPLGLDKVGDALDLPIKKDKRGKFLINKLCKPRKPTKKDPSTRCRDPELLAELYAYCKRDSDAEESLGNTVGDLPRGEFSTWVLDQKINVRGILVDSKAVEGALKIVNHITKKLEKELTEITDKAVTSGGEVARILAWCKQTGAYWLVNLQAGHIEDCLKQFYKYDKDKNPIFTDDDSAKVYRVLKIRQLLSRASTKKLIKFRDCRSPDERIRCLLQYHGAGTGRWAGRGVQPQNFPRGAMDLNDKIHGMSANETVDALLTCITHGDSELLELHFGDPMEAVASALRGMFIASPGKKFFVADFAAIEARVLMWLCGQMDAVESFYAFDNGKGVDIYCVMASKIYGMPITKADKDERQQGKVVILGCGYQMSGGALQVQAEQNYNVIISRERANELVDIFRKTYPLVPAFWKEIEWAAVRAVKYKTSTEIISGNGIRIGFQYVTDDAGAWLAMILPSNRKLWYYQPGLETKTITYMDKETGEPKTFQKESLYYSGRNNKKGGAWGRVFTYGGMLTENAVQAIARDLMVAAMRRVEKENFEIVLTVHDELLAEADESRDHKEFEKLVAGPSPEWAVGCPVSAEGWSGRRYRK